MTAHSVNKIIFWVVGIALLAYSTTRAYLLPITIDEGTTYLVYARHELMNIFLNRPINTNNHFLNSLLVRWSTQAFGINTMAVRLPGLLAHLMYIVFSFKLLQAISQRTIVILAGIVLLHLNPYFIEFFGLARGYGLGFAMMMASMYYFLKYMQTRQKRFITWSFLFAGLGVYSILILLNYLLALIAAFNFIWLRDYLQSENRVNFLPFFLRKNTSALAVCAALFALLAKPISEVRNNNELFGERHDFFTDTIMSITHVSLYQKNYFGTDFYLVLIGMAIFIYFAIIAYSIYALVKKQNTFLTDDGLAFCLLFSIFCWSTIAQFHLLDVPYLSERTALPYIPLYSVLPVFFLTFFKKNRVLQFAFCLLPIIAGTYHFANCANIKEVKEWWFDRETKEVLAYVEANETSLVDIEIRDERPTFSTGSWNSPSFHFHIIEGNLKKKLKPWRRDVFKKDEYPDYYYIWFDKLKDIDEKQYELMKKFRFGALLKLKKE